MCTIIMGLLVKLVLISQAVACDFTLYAQSQITNIWDKVHEIDPVQSPYVLCLAGSTATKRFTIDDSPGRCLWVTNHLIIQ